ncbi:MAG: flagellar basal body rod protein FlgC [Phycisphaerales bacterium]|nr:flagellar basal body rod protein FlgC [Phycisphaerales bacterium]
MYGAFDISTSGMTASRVRLEVSSANIANADSILSPDGTRYEPYRRRAAILAAGDPDSASALGVHVASIETDESPLVPRFEPGSPYADAGGYVLYPNVNVVVEELNAMEAVRNYEANAAAVEATRAMINTALQMIG